MHQFFEDHPDLNSDAGAPLTMSLAEAAQSRKERLAALRKRKAGQDDTGVTENG